MPRSPTVDPRPHGGTGDTSRTMARGSGLNLVGAICKQSALFLITIVLALRLGKADVGRYAESYALLSLLGLLALAGLRAGLTRFIAMNLADNDPARLRGTVRLGMALTLICSIVIAAALAVASPAMANLFDDPTLQLAIVLVALTLPGSALQDAALAATQGWRSQREFALIGLIFDPTLRLLLTFGAVILGAGLYGALWALFVSSWAGAILAGVSLHRRMRKVPQASAVFEVRRIFSFSMISWFSALASTGLIWADTLLLGALSTQDNVGVYNVATRLVTLAIFVMAPINAAFTPHIAHFSHVGDRPGMSRAYGSANRWIMRLSMPAFIMLLVFPNELLAFFPKGFRSSAAVAVIVILAVGQIVSAAAGPCGSVLNMSGRVIINMLDNVAALIVNIGLNLWLIPADGIVGAAVAWSVSLILANVVKALQVRYLLGVTSADAGWTKTLLAAVPAAGVGFLVNWQIDGHVLAVLLGGVAVCATLIVLLRLLGLEAEDAAIVRSLLRRVRLASPLT